MAARLRRPADDAFCAAAVQEVERLHAFFVGWLGGTIERKSAAFAACAGALAAGFVHIDPDGAVADREALLERLEEAHGRLGEDFRISIRNPRARALDNDLCLVVYEEWQARPEGEKGRVSTALMRRDTEAPAGLAWLHVHETWLPG